MLSGSGAATRIMDVLQRSPVRVLFPRAGAGATAVEEAVFVNTAGGIAGGDRLEYDVTALGRASIVVTSQAAEKVYRALSAPARVTTRLAVRDAARLAWLPQQTILFDGGRLRRVTDIALSSDAELLALEWLVLGRAAHGEEIVRGHVSDAWRVQQDGRLIWADGFWVTDEVFPRLHEAALLADCTAVGTALYFGPRTEARLALVRDIAPSLECQCAATSVAGLVIVRFAAQSSFDLRLALRRFLEQFGGELEPGPFRVPKMWSC